MRKRKKEPIRAWCTRCQQRVYQHRGQWLLKGQVFKCNECIYKDKQRDAQDRGDGNTSPIKAITSIPNPSG